MDLQEISDRLEIADVITRYTRAVDTGRWETDLADVFTEDAVLDYSAAGGPSAGLEEGIAFIGNLTGFLRWQHLIGQVAIDLAGDEARATAYFTNPMVALGPDGKDVLYEVGGYYHHDLVRTPDGWRSRKIVDDIVWSRGF